MIILFLSIPKKRCKETGSAYFELYEENSKSISLIKPNLLTKILCLLMLL